ncbi:MAG: hypothetical protein KBF83_06940 [Pyrinomonadaceae bacterium]|nr:hypothetical protein [Pyrinomonadaceae bacterium]MBP9109275.1 hypothetical protein [Pyrinomonadaceae bacterium]
MDPTRIHIFLNYIPLIGMVLGIAMLLYGMWRSGREVSRSSLWLFVVTALLTLAVYATGEIAGKGAALMAGPPWTNIVAHRASALPTFLAIELTGIFALVGLIRMFRGKGLARWNALVVLILAIVSLTLAARTTHFGRQIFVLSDSFTPQQQMNLAGYRGDTDRKDNNTEKKLWLA